MTLYVIIAVAIVVAAILIYRKHKDKAVKDLTMGLQVFNRSGDLIFDLSNNTTYVLGSGSTGTSDGTLSDSRIVAGRTWVMLTSTEGLAATPVFTIQDGSISWKYLGIFFEHRFNRTFIYGVY